MSGICTLGFVYVPDGTLKIVLMALGLGTSAALLVLSPAVCGEIASRRQLGTVLGAFVCVYSLAGVLAPSIAGFLVGHAGTNAGSGYNLVFIATGFLVIAGGLLAVLLIHPERDATRLATISPARRP